MRVFVSVFAVVVWLATTHAGYAQCANGRCVRPSSAPTVTYSPAVTYSVPVQAVSQVTGIPPGSLEWGVSQSDPGVLVLFSAGRHLGYLDIYSGAWTAPNKPPENLREMVGRINPPDERTTALAKAREHARDVGRLVSMKSGKCAGTDCDCESCEGAGCKCKPTTGAVKIEALPALGGPQNQRDNGPPMVYQGGVDQSKLRFDGDHFSIRGTDITRTEAMSSLAAARSVPNDSAAVRITVIGGESVRQQVLADLENRPELAFWKGRLVVSSYPADHWRIRDGGFKSPSDPNGVMVYCQKPDGTVLYRQEGYASGPVGLRTALRDRVPGYDPAKDPNPDPPPAVKPVDPTPVKRPVNLLLWLVGGGVAVGGLAYARKGK